MLSKRFLRFEGSVSRALQAGWAWVPTTSPSISRLLKEWRRRHGFNATGACSVLWTELYQVTVRRLIFFAQRQPLNFISLQSLLTSTEVRATTCPQRHPNPDAGEQQLLQHSSGLSFWLDYSCSFSDSHQERTLQIESITRICPSKTVYTKALETLQSGHR